MIPFVDLCVHRGFTEVMICTDDAKTLFIVSHTITQELIPISRGLILRRGVFLPHCTQWPPETLDPSLILCQASDLSCFTGRLKVQHVVPGFCQVQ